MLKEKYNIDSAKKCCSLFENLSSLYMYTRAILLMNGCYNIQFDLFFLFYSHVCIVSSAACIIYNTKWSIIEGKT